MNEFISVLTDWVAREWIEHARADYSTIESIPSGSAKYFAQHIRSLSADERDALVSGLSMRPLAELTETDHPTLAMVNENVAIKRFHEAEAHKTIQAQWNSSSIRFWRSVNTSLTLGSDFWSAFKDMAASAEGMSAATAKQVKPRLVKRMNSFFGATPPKRPGGTLHWEKPIKNVSLFAFMDFGSMNYQLRYAVGIRDGQYRWPSIGMSYERLMGISYGGWDQIESSRIDEALDVLENLITRLENLYRGIVPLMKGTHNKAL